MGQIHLGDSVTIGASKGVVTLNVREQKPKGTLQKV